MFVVFVVLVLVLVLVVVVVWGRLGYTSSGHELEGGDREEA